ncbi:MAG: hypothetical protein WBM43_11710 [Flavobacteriaceae bacterium]
MRLLHFWLIIPVLLLLNSCQWGPREKEVVLPGIQELDSTWDEGLSFDMHRIRVLEILPSDSYLYLKVSEEERKFWIATRKSEFYKDSVYYYQEALLKQNFESKQLNRQFDSIYLVTNLVPEKHFQFKKEKFHK